MTNIAKLRWRCRRGTKELDFVLGRFLEKEFSELTTRDQQAFESLLEQQDPDLIAWLWSGEPPPAALQDIVAKVRRVTPTPDP